MPNSEGNHLLQVIYQAGQCTENVTSCYSGNDAIQLEGLFRKLDDVGPKNGDMVNFLDNSKLVFFNNTWQHRDLQ